MRKFMLITFCFITAASPLALSAEAPHGASPDFAAIKPVLTAKCAVCHASDMKRVFSSKIPVWNHMTGTHVGLARKKYDMDNLLAQGAAVDDASLQMLASVIQKNNMPPVQYKIFHPKMRVKEDERTDILNWIYTARPEWKPAA